MTSQDDEARRAAATAYSFEYGSLMEASVDIAAAFEAGAAWAAKRDAEEHAEQKRKLIAIGQAASERADAEIARLREEIERLKQDQHPDYSVRPRIQHENDKALYVLQVDHINRLAAQVEALRWALKRIFDGGVPLGEAANIEQRMLAICGIAGEALARAREMEDGG